ncbi:DUF202 domain-containing protein [Actinoplanes sp. TBRC 11911]|uniref:DUF202 domain-containing protein n=1 Tax=Actinoplanes sp. TBRC 11911 TaxID=2729386 RepID=UPI00145E4F3A|nr:DUF202 domain-containing protein [Actinoplanes sp. TBRC 11911]NMO52684.1 DUF202 domain-containing protein [Actinoplanes sp. TBRC 11911]
MSENVDHGASAERTGLAWRRTILSATIVALLLVRPVFHRSAGTTAWLIAGLAMAGWAAVLAISFHRQRGLATRPPHPGRRTIPAYALIIVTLAILGGLVVIL